jgi:hypothetical protein
VSPAETFTSIRTPHLAKINAANERLKHAYFDYLRHARRRSEASVDAAAAAIARFEEANLYKAFKAFHRRQAVAFKEKLSAQVSARTGERLSRATVHSNLTAVREFFLWLADRPGFKTRIHYTDADYFNLTDKEVRIARAARDKSVPTLDQIHYVRGQAARHFDRLDGLRDGAGGQGCDPAPTRPSGPQHAGRQ